jgi:hypothetical protein
MVKTYNEFCRAIRDTYAQRTRFAETHNFHFSAQNDEWERSWSGRVGTLLEDYRERWAKLEDKVKYMNTDHNRNPRIKVGTRSGGHSSSRGGLGSAFGGSIRSQIRL